MRLTKIIFVAVITALVSTNRTSAQENTKSGIHALNLLGKSYNSKEILNLFELNSQKNRNELLNPSGNSYIIESPDGGYALEFDINFTVKSIRLFDAGFTYKRSKIIAPYQVALGMHIDTVHLNNLLFQFDEYAEFKLIGDFADARVELYFKADHIEMIKIDAKREFLEQANLSNAVNWKYRLIPDGECVSGECTNDSGYMKWGNGIVEYKGQWTFGFPHGQGLYRDSFGNTYQGEFKLGFFWGSGTFTRSTEYYQGEMVMGEKTGNGIAKYSNGSTYDGQWKKDIISGRGRLEIDENYFYEGDFENGNYQGQGKLGSRDGYYEGGFANGRPHGRGVQYAYNSEKKLEGKWKDGLKHGIFQLSSPAASTKTLRFENDIEVPMKDN
jgi:hypothetical protein